MKKIILFSLFFFALLSVSVKGQLVYVNPLERWAEFNLESLNTFATGDVKTSNGTHFQFGRNIPFTAGLTLSRDVIVDLNDSKIWGEGDAFPAFPTSGNAWHDASFLTNAYTWTSIVGAATSSPESYKGVNGGDPSPVGWHIPTLNESKVLIWSGINFSNFGVVQQKNEHSVDILGNGVYPMPGQVTAPADFLVVDESTIVAHRFKGSVYESAFRWKLNLTEKYVEIAAKPAGNSTIDDIKSAGYDWSDALVRYFPLAGRFAMSSSYEFNNNSMGHEVCLWVSNSVNESGQYVVMLKNTGIVAANIARQDGLSIRSVRNTPTSLGSSQIQLKKNGSETVTWYKAGASSSTNPAFHGADLGEIGSLVLGGQINVLPKTTEGANVIMWYQINDGDSVAVNLPFDSNPQGWSTSLHKDVSHTVDLSGLTVGETYVLKVWFQGGRNLNVWDKTSKNAYTSILTKAGNTTGLNRVVDSSIKINISSRRVSALFNGQLDVTLYSISGETIVSETAINKFSYIVTPGFYLLAIDNNIRKILIR